MLGLVIYLLMMATAFMGYVLPWGQMSYWGAQVITGFFSAFPLVGEPIRVWLLGGYAPDQAALTRFFSLHYLLPFVIAGVVILHIWALHIPGSGNPTGVEVKNEKDTLPFHPFYTAKDGWFAGAVPDRSTAAVLFFAPNCARPPGQLHPGQPAGDAGAHRSRMVFLAVLRDPARLHGRLHPAGQAVGRAGDVRLDPAAVLPAVARQVAGALGQLPAGVQALLLAADARRRRCSAMCGGAPADAALRRAVSQIATAYYFAHFLIILPLVSKFETAAAAAVDSISEAVLHGETAGSGADRAQTARRGRIRGTGDHGPHHRHFSSGWASPASC